MPKQNQTKSQYLESLQKNVPQQQVQSKSDYLAQVKQNQQRQQIDDLNYQQQLDKLNEDFAKDKKYDKSSRKPVETDIDKRVKRINKFTGSGPMTTASMGASFIKPIGQAAPGALGTALQGDAGGFFQGGMKSISSGSNVARSLQRRQYVDQLGAVGKVEQGTKAINNVLRLSYSANLLKGIAGAASGTGSIAPTSSMYGTMSGVVGNPAMMALTGANVLSSMMGSKKRKQLMLMRRPNPEEFVQKFSKAQFLDPFYRRLRSQDLIQPYEQLTYMLLSYIESYTSVLPSLYTDLKFIKDQKDKAGDQVKQEKDKASEKYSLINQFEDAINTVVTKYDPVAQLTGFIFGKTTPKKILEDIQKGKGLTGGQLRAHEDKAKEIGISSNQLRLIDISSASLISSGQSYEAKMLALSSASYDINRLMAQESITIRKHGFGIEHNRYSRAITKENVFIKLFKKFDDLIQYMPVISAGYNIVKDTILFPLKGAKFLQGMFERSKQIFFGKDFLRYGDKREIDKDVGIYKTAEKRSTEFIADGLPTNLEKIRTLGAQQLDAQLNIFDVLKNQYGLMHQQMTGQASGFEYSQRVSDDVISERIWDSFERKMLSQEGFKKSLDKKETLRQLKVEKASEKSVLGVLNLLQSGFQGDPKERLDKLYTPLNTIAQKITGKEAYFAGTEKFTEFARDDDIRFGVKGQNNVRGVSLEIERKKQDAQDVVGSIGTSIGSMIGVGAAAALGPLGLVLTGAMPIAKFMSSQYFDKKLYEKELKELGSSNMFGRNITSLQDEFDKRDPIKDRESGPTVLPALDKIKSFSSNDIIESINELKDKLVSKFNKLEEGLIKSDSLKETLQVQTDKIIKKLSGVSSIVFLKDKLVSKFNKLTKEISLSSNNIINKLEEGLIKSNLLYELVKDQTNQIINLMSIPKTQDSQQEQKSNIIYLSDLQKNKETQEVAAYQEESKYQMGTLPIFKIQQEQKEQPKFHMGALPQFNTQEVAAYQEEEKSNIIQLFPNQQQQKEVQYKAVSGSSVLMPHTPIGIVGEKGPEVIMPDGTGGIRILNEEQVKNIFSGGINELIKDPAIPKFAKGGTLPPDQSKASDYDKSSVFSKMYNVLVNIKDSLSKPLTDKLGMDNLGTNLLENFEKLEGSYLSREEVKENKIVTELKNLQEYLKESVNFEGMQVNTLKELAGFEKLLDQDPLEQGRQEAQKIVNTAGVGTRIQEHAEKQTEQAKFSALQRDLELQEEQTRIARENRTILERLKDVLKETKSGFMGIFTGLLPLIAAGAAFATMFATDFKIGTTAVAGIVGKVTSAIFKGIAKFFDPKMLKTIGESVTKIMPKSLLELGTKFLASIGLKGGIKVGAKTLGKMIPGLGMLFGTYFAGKRLLKGDYVGALGEFAGGIASTFPGLGTALSLGIDTWLFLRDKARTEILEEKGQLEPFDPSSVAGSFFKMGPKLAIQLFGPKLALKTIGKRLPFLGAPIGMYYATQRLKQGDTLGALGEFASGMASLIPLVGIPIGLGIDALLAFRDLMTSKEEREESHTGIGGGLTKLFTKSAGMNLLAYIAGKTGKIGAQTFLKSLAKKIPIVGAVVGGYFAYKRLQEGDVLGAVGELGSGLASIIPLFGTGVNVGIDVLLALRDMATIKEERSSEGGLKIANMFNTFGSWIGEKFTEFLYALPLVGPIFKMFFDKDTKDRMDSIFSSKEIIKGEKLSIWEKLGVYTRELFVNMVGSVLSTLPIVGGFLSKKWSEAFQIDEKLLSGKAYEVLIDASQEKRITSGLDQLNQQGSIFSSLKDWFIDGIANILGRIGWGIGDFIKSKIFGKLTDTQLAEADLDAGSRLVYTNTQQTLRELFVDVQKNIVNKAAEWLVRIPFGIGKRIEKMMLGDTYSQIEDIKDELDNSYVAPIDSRSQINNIINDAAMEIEDSFVSNMSKRFDVLKSGAKDAWGSTKETAKSFGQWVNPWSKPISVVGEKGPEAIVGNQVLNKDQVQQTLGTNIQSLINDPSIPKFAEGGTLPTSDTIISSNSKPNIKQTNMSGDAIFSDYFKGIVGDLSYLVKGFFNINKKVSEEDLSLLKEPTKTKLDKFVDNKSIVDKIKHHIISSEGIALKKYKDSLGYDTIGIGHLIQPDETFPETITLDTAKSIFDKDFNKHVLAARQFPVFNQLSDVRKGALTDLVFNMGANKLSEFKKTLSYLEQSNYPVAAKELLKSKYAAQVGNRARRVSKLIATDDPIHFNSDKPRIIKAALGTDKLAPYTIVGEKGPEVLDIINQKIYNADHVKNLFGININDLIKEVPVSEHKINVNDYKKELPENNLIKKAKEYDQIKLASISNDFETQQQTQRSTKTEPTNNTPVIIDNSTVSNTTEDSNSKENVEGSFTKIDDSLDRIIYNIFNASVNIMSQAPTNFVFNNDFSFDF